MHRCSRLPQRWRDPPVTRQPRTLTLTGELSIQRCYGRELAVLRVSPIAAECIYRKSCRGNPLVVFRAGKHEVDVESGCLGTGTGTGTERIWNARTTDCDAASAIWSPYWPR